MCFALARNAFCEVVYVSHARTLSKQGLRSLFFSMRSRLQIIQNDCTVVGAPCANRDACHGNKTERQRSRGGNGGGWEEILGGVGDQDTTGAWRVIVTDDRRSFINYVYKFVLSDPL